MGLRKPRLKILGIDFVIEVASNVTSFQSRDRMFDLSSVRFGAHAEYLCIAADSAVALIPEKIPFEQAVVCEDAWYANNNLRKMNLQAGKKILIYGASGAVGTAAVQLGKYYGAEVTAVVDTARVELTRKDWLILWHCALRQVNSRAYLTVAIRWTLSSKPTDTWKQNKKLESL